MPACPHKRFRIVYMKTFPSHDFDRLQMEKYLPSFTSTRAIDKNKLFSAAGVFMCM